MMFTFLSQSNSTSLPFGGRGSAWPELCGCHVILLECIDLKSQGVSILALSVYILQVPKNTKQIQILLELQFKYFFLRTKFSNFSNIQVEISKFRIFKNISSPGKKVSKSQKLRNVVLYKVHKSTSDQMVYNAIVLYQGRAMSISETKNIVKSNLSYL